MYTGYHVLRTVTFGTIWADTLFLLPFASITVTPIPTYQIKMHRLWRNEHISLVTAGLELFQLISDQHRIRYNRSGFLVIRAAGDKLCHPDCDGGGME